MSIVLNTINWVAPALGGALLMLIYLKRVQDVSGLQDLQDGIFALLIFSIAVRFFIERKLRAVTSG